MFKVKVQANGTVRAYLPDGTEVPGWAGLAAGFGGEFLTIRTSMFEVEADPAPARARTTPDGRWTLGQECDPKEWRAYVQSLGTRRRLRVGSRVWTGWDFKITEHTVTYLEDNDACVSGFEIKVVPEPPRRTIHPPNAPTPPWCADWFIPAPPEAPARKAHARARRCCSWCSREAVPTPTPRPLDLCGRCMVVYDRVQQGAMPDSMSDLGPMLRWLVTILPNMGPRPDRSDLHGRVEHFLAHSSEDL